jgi:hypothetical protein
MDERLPRFDRLPTIGEQIADNNNSTTLGDMMNKGMVLDSALSQEHSGLIEHIQSDIDDQVEHAKKNDTP